MYPWAASLYMQQGEELLDALREDMVLEVKDKILTPWLREMLQTKKAELLNIEGQSFQGSIVVEEPPLQHDQQQQQLEQGAAGSLSAEQLASYDDVMRLFEGNCYVYAGEYWNYEWCPKREVRQFHVEHGAVEAFHPPPQPNDPSPAEQAAIDALAKANGMHPPPPAHQAHQLHQAQQLHRAPDWSLGQYKKKIVIRENGDNLNPSAAIIKIVEYHKRGQQCEVEAGRMRGRASEVHIQCCDGSGIAPPSAEKMAIFSSGGGGAGSDRRFVAGVLEPSLCSYQIVVCAAHH